MKNNVFHKLFNDFAYSLDLLAGPSSPPNFEDVSCQRADVGSPWALLGVSWIPFYDFLAFFWGVFAFVGAPGERLVKHFSLLYPVLDTPGANFDDQQAPRAYPYQNVPIIFHAFSGAVF